jgi:hypothetical protein
MRWLAFRAYYMCVDFSREDLKSGGHNSFDLNNSAF